MRTAFQRGTRTALDEVERGEDFLKDKFETALKDSAARPQTMAVIREGWSSAKKGCDRAKRPSGRLAA